MEINSRIISFIQSQKSKPLLILDKNSFKLNKLTENRSIGFVRMWESGENRFKHTYTQFNAALEARIKQKNICNPESNLYSWSMILWWSY